MDSHSIDATVCGAGRIDAGGLRYVVEELRNVVVGMFNPKLTTDGTTEPKTTASPPAAAACG
jgi:hypothetical protein